MYKVVIGLEVHCELETKSKNFSFAPNEFTEAHNINVGTVDLGLPGILPIANREAVRKALFTSIWKINLSCMESPQLHYRTFFRTVQSKLLYTLCLHIF